MDSWIMYIRFGYVKSFIIKICCKVLFLFLWPAGQADAVLRDLFSSATCRFILLFMRLYIVEFLELILTISWENECSLLLFSIIPTTTYIYSSCNQGKSDPCEKVDYVV